MQMLVASPRRISISLDLQRPFSVNNAVFTLFFSLSLSVMIEEGEKQYWIQ
jgi:hypothetical protein